MARSSRLVNESQLALWEERSASLGGVRNLANAFRRLYYHLYTNSDASRAERILEDLSLILLLKLATEVNGGAEAIGHYRDGDGTANELLMPVMRSTFPELIGATQQFNLGDNALRDALNHLDKVNLSCSPAHVLGEAFQALIGPRLRGEKGQFFTPRSLVRAMVQIVAPGPNESVLDPACGTGGFLIETHVYQTSRSSAVRTTGELVGIDKDLDLARLAAALTRITSQGRSRVWNFNSLDVLQWQKEIEKDELSNFDVVLTNPPFGSRIAVRDREILRKYDLGRQWVQVAGEERWRPTDEILSAQDPQILFIELCVSKLKPGGRMGIVLPEGVFGNRQQGYVWRWLRQQGRILALLDCPRTTFQPGTDTKTNVLFFRKETSNKEVLTEVSSVRIAVALNCGHDRRGRTHLPNGGAYPDDFAQLGEEFHRPLSQSSSWREVTLTSPDYFVPRYYAKQMPLSGQEADLTRGAAFASLGELVEARLLTIRKGHEVGSDAYGTGNVPFVRTSDLSNFEISADPTKSVSEDIYHVYKQQQRLKPGDILMVVDGRYRIGATALLTENNYKCVVQSHLRIIGTPHPSELDPFELLFALNLPSVRLRIRDLVFVQSTLGTLGKRLLELRIPILRGEGPWLERVEAFRAVLLERDRLFAELRVMSGPDFEL